MSNLRIFFEGGVFESHPLTIANVPSSASCVASQPIVLGALGCRRLDTGGLDLGEYETVLLVAGGAGVTFTLGLR
jgi:ferric-chelate reductase